MTRLEMKLAKLRQRYEDDMFHLDLRLKRARRIGKAITADRGNAWDRVREMEQTKDRLAKKYREDVLSCYRDNKLDRR